MSETCLLDEYDFWLWKACTDYKLRADHYKEFYSFDLYNLEEFVRTRDSKLFIEQLVQKILTECEKESTKHHTHEVFLKKILIPFFFDKIESRGRYFSRESRHYLSWFPIKKPLVFESLKSASSERYLISEREDLMKTHYPKLYQFYRDMTSWTQYTDSNTQNNIIKENRKKYSLTSTPDESSSEFFVRLLVVLDSLDPHPHYTMLFVFFIDFIHYLALEGRYI